MDFITDILDKQMQALEWVEHNAGLCLNMMLIAPAQAAAGYIERRLDEINSLVRA